MRGRLSDSTLNPVPNHPLFATRPLSPKHTGGGGGRGGEMETGKASPVGGGGGGDGISRQDTAASHNSTGQGEFDFSDQLFNQLDNYVREGVAGLLLA